MRTFLTAIIYLMILNSCNAQKLKVDNKKPMYGEVEKSKEHKKIDQDFIQECLDQFGSIDSSVIVYTDIAWRYYYNNSLETAMKRFNQVWILNPDFPDAYFGFAALMETEGKDTEAKRFYKIGLAKDVKLERAPICYQRIADCKEQLNDIKGTIAAYEQIVKRNPNNVFAYKKIGYFQMELGYTEEAFKAYNKAIQLDPNDAMTYNNRAYLNQTINNLQAAIDDYSKAIELNPNYISALVNRGITEMQLNHFQKAKKDFEKCIQLDPKAGELWRFLGISKLNLNEKTGACKDFNSALELGDQIAGQLINENCK